jgi:CheY-like chemotaxis protein
MNRALPRRVKSGILIVDADDSTRQVLESLLTREGYEVKAAPDGQAALLSVREAPPN